MFVIVADTFVVIRLRKRRVHRLNHVWDDERNNNRQTPVQRQIFILMLASVGIFLITTLPLAIGKIIFPQEQNFLAAAISISTIWTGLGWFQSLNYAVSWSTDWLTTLWTLDFHRFRSISTSIVSRRSSFAANFDNASDVRHQFSELQFTCTRRHDLDCPDGLTKILNIVNFHLHPLRRCFDLSSRGGK